MPDTTLNVKEVCKYLHNKGKETFVKQNIFHLLKPSEGLVFVKNNWELSKKRKDYIIRICNYNPELQILEIQILALRIRRVSCGVHNSGHYKSWKSFKYPQTSLLSLTDFQKSTPYSVSLEMVDK